MTTKNAFTKLTNNIVWKTGDSGSGSGRGGKGSGAVPPSNEVGAKHVFLSSPKKIHVKKGPFGHAQTDCRFRKICNNYFDKGNKIYAFGARNGENKIQIHFPFA